jgi:hypothetical protein
MITEELTLRFMLTLFSHQRPKAFCVFKRSIKFLNEPHDSPFANRQWWFVLYTGLKLFGS